MTSGVYPRKKRKRQRPGKYKRKTGRPKKRYQTSKRDIMLCNPEVNRIAISVTVDKKIDAKVRRHCARMMVKFPYTSPSISEIYAKIIEKGMKKLKL